MYQKSERGVERTGYNSGAEGGTAADRARRLELERATAAERVQQRKKWSKLKEEEQPETAVNYWKDTGGSSAEDREEASARSLSSGETGVIAVESVRELWPELLAKGGKSQESAPKSEGERQNEWATIARNFHNCGKGTAKTPRLSAARGEELPKRKCKVKPSQKTIQPGDSETTGDTPSKAGQKLASSSFLPGKA